MTIILTDIDNDCLLHVLKKTDAPVWNRLMQVSVKLRGVTKNMLRNLVVRLSERVRRVFSIRTTIQIEALLHFFLKTSIKASHRRMSVSNQTIISQLLRNHLKDRL